MQRVIVWAELLSFGREAPFRQKGTLSAEYRYRQKWLISNNLLSAFGRKRKTLFRLISISPSVVRIYYITFNIHVVQELDNWSETKLLVDQEETLNQEHRSKWSEGCFSQS